MLRDGASEQLLGRVKPDGAVVMCDAHLCVGYRDGTCINLNCRGTCWPGERVEPKRLRNRESNLRYRRVYQQRDKQVIT